MKPNAKPEKDAGENLMSYEPAEVIRSIVTLNNAQIKALATTAPEVVPSPGAGKIAVFRSAIVQVTIGLTPYTLPGAFASYSFYTVAGESVLSIRGNLTPILTAPSTIGIAYFLPIFVIADNGFGPVPDVTVNTGSVNPFENQPIVFFEDSSFGDLTGGDDDNSAKITTFYTLIEV